MEEVLTPATALFTLDLLIRLALSVRVINRRLDVGVSLAWLFVITLFPLVGALVYITLGERRLGRRRAAFLRQARADRKERLAITGAENRVNILVATAGAATAKLIAREVDSPALSGNCWELLGDWQSALTRLISDIDSASHSCWLEFYIWNDGGMADDVAAAVERAARRGVACRILVDDLGSRPFLRGANCRRLRAAGVDVRKAMTTSPWHSLFVRGDLRMHRKIAVIDNRTAYTGSLNLVDPRFFKQNRGVGQWVDAMIRVEGPVVEQLLIVLTSDWAQEGGTMPPAEKVPACNARPTNESAIMQVIPSGPDETSLGIERILLQALYAAEREVVMTTPYFVPDVQLMSALVSAAQRGVAVTLIVPARVDSHLAHWASQAFQGDLANFGVKICLFEQGLLHTKSLAIDGEFSLFGSVNLDPRSLHLDFEITVAVYNRDFTQALLALQNRYIESSRPLDLEAWRRRRFGKRLLHDTARLVGPLL